MPTPSSTTSSPILPPLELARSPRVPDVPVGKACFRALETSSLTMRPQRTASSTGRFMGSRSSSTLTLGPVTR